MSSVYISKYSVFTLFLLLFAIYSSFGVILFFSTPFSTSDPAPYGMNESSNSNQQEKDVFYVCETVLNRHNILILYLSVHEYTKHMNCIFKLYLHLLPHLPFKASHHHYQWYQMYFYINKMLHVRIIITILKQFTWYSMFIDGWLYVSGWIADWWEKMRTIANEAEWVISVKCAVDWIARLQ